MSSRSLKSLLAPRLMIGAAILAAAAVFGGCTVRPLYGTAERGEADGLAAISVMPVSTREALEVRNHLIFLFTNGKGLPADPELLMKLDVVSRTANAASVQVAIDNEPSAGTVTLSATYTLSDVASETILSSGERSIIAAFDLPQQRYAAERAERDAENRAARELAELLRLAVLHDLERLNLL